MNKTELEQKVMGIFTDYDYTPEFVQGRGFPIEFLMFGNFIRLCGRDIYLRDGMCYGNPSESEKEIYDRLNDLLWQIESDCGMYERKFPIEIYHNNLKAIKLFCWDDLVNRFEDVLKCDLNRGFVYMVDQSYFHDKNALVKSKYMDCEYNYSPYIYLNPSFLSEEYISRNAAYFANALFENMPCQLITIKFNKAIPENDVSTIHNMMRKVFTIINQYSIEEYRKHKDEEEYQHRDDWNPEDF